MASSCAWGPSAPQQLATAAMARIGTLVGVDVLGILVLYGDGDGGPPFIIKRVHGMCGHEQFKVPVAIEDGRAFVDGAEYKLVLRGHGSADRWTR